MKLFLLLLLLLISTVTVAKRYKCNKKYSCGCGSSNVEINERIMNDEQAIPCSWSMIVSLRYELSRYDNSIMHACGGAIVTESYILTAASCVEGIYDKITIANVTIAAGLHYRSKPIHMIRYVDQIIIHPNWTGSRNGYHDDIALLHLSEPIDLHNNSCTTRTCLPQQVNTPEALLQYPPKEQVLMTAGWGSILPNGKDSDFLKQAAIISLDLNSTKCKNIIHDSSKQFCAGLHDTSAGPCYGDFGGPVFHWIDEHWEQVGIASYTADKCKENSAVVYTRIAYYREWIEEHVKENRQITEELPLTITIPPIDITETPSTTYQCDKFAVPCGCGRRSVELPHSNSPTNNEAIPYSWSMIVSIRLNGTNNHSCSGSILTKSYILTSASCIANVPSYGISIVAGIHKLSEDIATNRKIDHIFLHPDYIGASENYANDIAILHMSYPLDFDEDIFVSPACLPEKQELLPHPSYYPKPGANLAVIGWGSMHCRNHTDEYALQQIQVTSMSATVKSCFVLEKHSNIQFCAGVEEDNTVPCAGDPGSPIFEWWVDRWELVGITSHVVDCAPFRNSVIYTRSVEYNAWIKSIVNNCSSESSLRTTTTTAAPVITTTTVSGIPTTTKAPILYVCNTSSTCGCGTVPVVLTPSRIIGGENARESSWPMIVSLRLIDDSSHHCGGSILSNSYVLTAAHCLRYFVSDPLTHLFVTAGIVNISDPKPIRRFVDRIYIHPDYKGAEDDFLHDIALLHLNESFLFENNPLLAKTCIHPINPAVLNSQYIKPNTRLTVIGWGRTVADIPRTANILQQVEVLAINNTDPICEASMNAPEIQFCAGLPEGGKDSCKGDSGGPIFQWAGQYWEQVGIVSHGAGCADAGYPGIYTRLSYYYDWINDILNTTNEHLEPQSQFDALLTEPNMNITSTETTSSMRSYGHNHQDNSFNVLMFIIFFTIILH